MGVGRVYITDHGSEVRPTVNGWISDNAAVPCVVVLTSKQHYGPPLRPSVRDVSISDTKDESLFCGIASCCQFLAAFREATAVANMQVPLNGTLREFIGSGFVHYEYRTTGFVDLAVGGASHRLSLHCLRQWHCQAWSIRPALQRSLRRRMMHGVAGGALQ